MATVKTRILVISDTHSTPLLHADERRAEERAFALPLPKVDLLIHAGDLTNFGDPQEHSKALHMLAQINAPVKLVIPGNHDRTLDKEFQLAHTKDGRHAEHRWRAARDIWFSPHSRASREGVTMLDEGLHQVQLKNGAAFTVYATPYTPEFRDWAFPYERSQDRFNPPGLSLTDADNIAVNVVPDFHDASASIDLMVTHGPPYGRMDETLRGDHAGCPHLLRAVMRARPRMHVFGHIHEGHGAERITWKHDDEQLPAVGIDVWQNGAWKAGLADGDASIRTIEVDRESAKKTHAIYLDVSSTSSNALKHGSETLMINAAIMDAKSRPVNAPWIIDIELPVAG